MSNFLDYSSESSKNRKVFTGGNSKSTGRFLHMKKESPIPPFHVLLLIAEARLAGEKQAVAKAIGVTPSRYSRVRSGEGGGMQPENLFRLARLIDRSPGVVLRSAGRHDLATLIETAYGPLPDSASPETDELLGLYALVTDPADRAAGMQVWRSLAGVARAHSLRPPSHPPKAPAGRRAS